MNEEPQRLALALVLTACVCFAVVVAGVSHWALAIAACCSLLALFVGAR